MSQTGLWIVFHIFLVGMLALDLGVFNRKAHVIGIKEALTWTGVWVGLALLWNLVIYILEGPSAAVQFLTAYLIEESLSVDNMFVFLMIFKYFHVPASHQHRVLFWGIVGALAARLTFILLGLALVKQFHAVIYVFAAFLIFTGIRMALQKDVEIHPDRNPVFRLLRPFMSSTSYDNEHFFVRKNRRLLVTPLFVVLMVIESSDIMFAIDSVPAVLGITMDPFIAYASNALAILGLRSLYFALGGLMGMFQYLHYGLAAILTLVGVKMMVSDFVHLPPWLTLSMIGMILFIAVMASIGERSRAARGAAKTKSHAKAKVERE
jgi:tellurite resistance protein TerC